jgi:glucose/arabinose dehydrogenase
MAFAPDGRLFVCEKSGTLRLIKNELLLADPVLTLDVVQLGESGLIGVALDPAFPSLPYVYVHYTVPSFPAHNRVSRFKMNGDRALQDSEQVILELSPLGNAVGHYGGAIHFGTDGKLHVATGDNETPLNSQSLSNLHGKVLRINSDGSIPDDNPFASQLTGSLRPIWALGLRSPFTFAELVRAGFLAIAVGRRLTSSQPEGTMVGLRPKAIPRILVSERAPAFKAIVDYFVNTLNPLE